MRKGNNDKFWPVIDIIAGVEKDRNILIELTPYILAAIAILGGVLYLSTK